MTDKEYVTYLQKQIARCEEKIKKYSERGGDAEWDQLVQYYDGKREAYKDALEVFNAR